MPVPCMRQKSKIIADGCVIRTMDYGEGGPEYRIHFAVTSAGCPARTYGPPEDCYPAEGPEWEITAIEAEDWVSKPGGVEHRWVPIEDTHDIHEIEAVEHWAEMLDLSEEAAEEVTDIHELYAESEADNRRDPLE